ncbi:unnamed protein product [Hydatigera taeniaeformis]|uniref:PLAT domain-containing protein n=1 Tax=Hydatigena taeniaeformis TaxID=6205 RepID=A0A0R3XA32_HYDTA|nr:unnamed protein product [Hydatigera taeniaeformis]
MLHQCEVFNSLDLEGWCALEVALETERRGEESWRGSPLYQQLCPLGLGHDNTDSSPTWYVERVEVESTETGEISLFPCNQWIDKVSENDEAYVDLPIQLAPSTIPPQSTIFYEFKIYTSNIPNAGTKASVYVVLTGLKGQKTSEVQLKGAFKQGCCEILYVDLEDVGEPLQSLHIRHNKEGINARWHLDRVEVRPMGSKLSDEEVYIFTCNRWLSDTATGGVTLNAAIGKRKLSSREEKNTYEIAVTTGEMSNFANTSGHVYLSLIDADGRREVRQLVARKGSVKPFQPGKSTYVKKSNADVEFMPVDSKVSIPSPASPPERHNVDMSEVNGEIPPIPSLEKLPPVPSESSVPSLSPDMPLPSPPPIGFNGSPRMPPLQQEGNNVTMEVPSRFHNPLPPLPPTKEEEEGNFSDFP